MVQALPIEKTKQDFLAAPIELVNGLVVATPVDASTTNEGKELDSKMLEETVAHWEEQ